MNIFKFDILKHNILYTECTMSSSVDKNKTEMSEIPKVLHCSSIL